MKEDEPGMTVETPAGSRGVAWRRVSKGLYLLGFGILLLLTTLEVLPSRFWMEALAFWPVLLVALGVRLIFERSPAPWLILLGPLLVFGVLASVAVAPPGGAELRDAVALRAGRPPGASRFSLEGKLALLRFDVAAGPLPKDRLVQGRSAPSGPAAVRIDDESGPGVVRLKNAWRRWYVVPLPGPRPVCELTLAADLPVAVDLGLALTWTTLDLGATRTPRVRIHGAFNGLTLRLGAPESDVRVDLAGAFNDVKIEVPPATPVRTVADGFVNIVEGREGAGALRGPGYSLHVGGAFNHVVVRSPLREAVPQEVDR